MRPLWRTFAPVLLTACAMSPGTSATDAGASPADGGSFFVDSGPRPADGGSAADAAPASDAGAGTDAGRVPDAGTDAGPPGLLDRALAELTDPAAETDALDALMHEVAFDHGWPLHDGTRWLFATRWDDAPGAVALVSDLNEWDTARDPAARAASGVHYFVLLDEASFATSERGAKYKWLSSGDYRAPPEATAYGADTFGEFGYVAPPTALAWRERFPAFRSAHLGPPRALRALLPAGFVPGSAAATDARQLFMHDGQNLFDEGAIWGGWRVDEAVSAAGFSDVVVLAVDNASDRMDAYTHVVDDVASLGTGPIGGDADRYLRLVHEEALPFFRARYGLGSDASQLVMAGSSLGGLVSLYQALRSPTQVHCVIAMSSTLGWGAFDPSATGEDALVRRWSTHAGAAIYLDSGGGGTCSDTDADGVDEDSDDSDNYCTTLQLRDRLEALGYEFDVDLFHWHEADAGHNEAAWAARFPAALDACVTAGWVAR